MRCSLLAARFSLLSPLAARSVGLLKSWLSFFFLLLCFFFLFLPVFVKNLRSVNEALKRAFNKFT